MTRRQLQHDIDGILADHFPGGCVGPSVVDAAIASGVCAVVDIDAAPDLTLPWPGSEHTPLILM